MNEQPQEHPGVPADPTAPAPPPTQPAEQVARRRRWDRITWIVIAAMVVAWAAALVFRNNLRATYWSWRLARPQSQVERERWVSALAWLGERHPDDVAGPALGLTGRSDAQVRLAGVRVLMSLARPLSPAATAPSADSHRRVLARLRELIDDPDPAVQAEALDGLELLDDVASLDRLLKMALDESRPRSAGRATAAIARIGSPEQSLPLLTRILHESNDPNVRAEAVDNLGRSLAPAPLELLVEALADVRQVTIRPVSEQLDPALVATVRQQFLKQGLSPALLDKPASQPERAEPDVMTVADYADRYLRQQTGKDFGFDARAPEPDRDAAIARWREFVSKRGA